MNSPLILLLETATSICSCALALGEQVVAYRQSDIPNAHSKCLSVMIDDLFKQSQYDYSDLSCVAVSKGPGSYTGLRIGVSTAKGVCYALKLPLISIDTLSILAFAAHKRFEHCLALPMIDARRMEVYCAIYDSDFNIIKPVSAEIIEGNIFDQYIKQTDKVVICGDGAAKCKSVLANKNYIFAEEILLSSKDMSAMAYKKFINKDYEDLAYFEPYYLKDFIAAPSHIKGLY